MFPRKRPLDGILTFPGDACFLQTHDVISTLAFGDSFKSLETGAVSFVATHHLPIVHTADSVRTPLRKPNISSTWK